MTRKDFQLIADALAAAHRESDAAELTPRDRAVAHRSLARATSHLVGKFHQHGAFDRNLFIQACYPGARGV